MELALTVTDQTSKNKPSRDSIYKLNFTEKTATIGQLAQYIKEGRAFSGCYKQKSFNIKFKQKYFFVKSNIIAIDIDNSDCEMLDYMVTLAMQPTISYTTYSNGMEGKGYRFRFLYVFEDDINADTFTLIYNKVCEANNITVGNDTSMATCNQMFFGNGSANCELVVSGNTYKTTDFIDGGDIMPQTSSFKPKKQDKTQPVEFSDAQFKNYWQNGSNRETLAAMRGYWSNEMTKIDFEEGELWRDLDDVNFYTIRRKWEMRLINGKKTATTVRIKDGEGRRKKIFLSLMRRRLINPSLTLEHLCYAALYELEHFMVNNGEDKITRKQLENIAVRALNTDVSNYADKLRENKHFQVNKEEAMKRGITTQKAVGMANGNRNRQKKLERYEQYKKFYDPTLTYKQNIQVLEEHGIKVSLRTYKTFVNEYMKKVQMTILNREHTQDIKRVNCTTPKTYKFTDNEQINTNEPIMEYKTTDPLQMMAETLNGIYGLMASKAEKSEKVEEEKPKVTPKKDDFVTRWRESGLAEFIKD